MKKFTIAVIIVLSLLVLAGAAYLTIYGGVVVSQSSRNGYLQKFGTKHIFWTTHEGELALHGSGGSNIGKPGQSESQFANTWAFSVDDEEVISQLEAIQNDENDPAKAVTVHYNEYYFQGWYDTQYRATKVLWLSNPSKPKPAEKEIKWPH
jgi:hypothetical protein